MQKMPLMHLTFTVFNIVTNPNDSPFWVPCMSLEITSREAHQPARNYVRVHYRANLRCLQIYIERRLCIYARTGSLTVCTNLSDTIIIIFSLHRKISLPSRNFAASLITDGLDIPFVNLDATSATGTLQQRPAVNHLIGQLSEVQLT